MDFQLPSLKLDSRIQFSTKSSSDSELSILQSRFRARKERTNILLVDDQPYLLFGLRMIFNQIGNIDIQEAYNGKQALDLL